MHGTTFLRINEALICFDTCSPVGPVLCLRLTYIDHYLLSPYQAVENGFASFHLYVCAAFLKHFSSEIKKENDFQVSVLMRVITNYSEVGWLEGLGNERNFGGMQ